MTTIDPHDDADLAGLQASAAGMTNGAASGEVISTRTVELEGRRFRIADKIGLMPLLKFSEAAGVSTEDPRALAAMYSMLKDSIYGGKDPCGDCEACAAGNEQGCRSYDPGDWEAFERHAIDTKAGADELLDVITKVIELTAGRPTAPPAGSSAGRRSISAGSTARSSGRRAAGSRH